MALIKEPVVTALNDSTFVAITLTAGNDGESLKVAIWTENYSAYIYATDSAGTNPVTNSGSLVYFPLVLENVTADGNPLMYVKAGSGTPNLIAQIIN